MSILEANFNNYPLVEFLMLFFGEYDLLSEVAS